METDKLIHPHSSTGERVYTSPWKKNIWKYVAAALGIIFIFCVQWSLLDYGYDNNASTNLTLIDSNERHEHGPEEVHEFIYNGPNNTQTYTHFPGFDSNTTQYLNVTLTAIYIYNVALDAATFSKSLNQFIGLEIIHLDNVSIDGNFTRAFLPHLKSFTLNQFEKDGQIGKYGEHTNLHSKIFFDNSKGNTWEVQDIGNLGVDIFVSLNGYKLIQINRNQGSIGLYVPDCNVILQNIEGTVTSLSLSTCTILKGSIPRNLENLNLFDVTVSDGSISEVFKEMTQITDLYYDLPGQTVDLNDLPKTLAFLSLSSATVIFSENASSALVNLQQLSIGFCNISAEVYESFNSIFPSIQRIAAFGMQSANYKLLKNIFNSKTSTWVLMEEFDRNVNIEDKTEIDNKLFHIGIPNGSSNFLIKKPRYSNTLLGIVLTNTQDQEREYRYSLLGWGQFLTFGAYKTAEKYKIMT